MRSFPGYQTACSYKAITEIMKKRILILDGAMGTQLQKFKLKLHHYSLLEANNDILNITQPKIIERIHTSYLEGKEFIQVIWKEEQT